MPLLDLQKGLRQLGKIRAGETKTSANGKSYPAKLTQWRLTSPSYELLEAAAHLYGGQVGKWEGAPTEGDQFEVFTTVDRLPVIVPPGEYALMQFHELWTAGGCARRCDGITEQLTGGPCVCPPDHDERAKLAAKGKACKITTRLKVLLPEIPDIGVWMLESHGYYAAVELAGAEEILQMAAARGAMIPAQLRLDQRTVKRPKADGSGVETRHFIVPVLELISTTAGALMAGERPALGNGHSAAIVAPSRAALDAPKVTPRTDAPEARATSEGPPMPPLPHEDPAVGSPAAGADGSAGAASPTPAARPASSTVNRVAIAAREAGLDDDGRHDLAEYVSEERTRSSAALDAREIGVALSLADRIKSGEVHLRRNDDGALVLLDGRFGWPAQDADPSTPGDDTAAGLSIEEAQALKGGDLTDALRTYELELGGTEAVRRQRLVEHLRGLPF